MNNRVTYTLFRTHSFNAQNKSVYTQNSRIICSIFPKKTSPNNDDKTELQKNPNEMMKTVRHCEMLARTHTNPNTPIENATKYIDARKRESETERERVCYVEKIVKTKFVT